MKIISQAVVYLSSPDKRAYCSMTFIEGSGDIPSQLQHLKEQLDAGLKIDSVDQVSGSFEV